jgi:hypothetical protein
MTGERQTRAALATRLPPRWLRSWPARLALSALAGVVAGLLLFALVRGGSGFVLFMQQQGALREVAAALNSGLDQPPPGNLRALRERVQALDIFYWRVSVVAGVVGAAVAAMIVYLQLERAAVDSQIESRVNVEKP